MDENIEELLPFYALGTLSPAERAQVEKYVASHPEARTQLDEMLQAASALPYAAPAAEPPPALKKQLMERVRADAASSAASQRERTRPLGGWLMPALSFASLVVAIAAVLWGLSLRGEVLRVQAQTAALQQELNSQRTVLAQITSPQAKTFAIAGTQLQPAAHGQVIADASTGSAVLIVSGLQPLAPDRTYEFWLIQGKSAVPAGLFNVDSEGRAILPVPHNATLASYNAVGVSIEPAGGSPQPSKDIVLLGNFY
jgi:anti-sigma-K factor RskA